MTQAHKNPSLIAKSNSRLAAAQLLYRVAMTGEAFKPEKLADDYARYLEDNQHNPKEAELPRIAPHKPLLKKLLEGVGQHREVLDELVNETLDTDWKRERMSPLMIAILQLGAYELDAQRNLATPMLVDEYTSLARAFFDEQEVGFVHAALNRIANKLRS